MECVPQFTFYNVFIGLCFAVIFILSLLGNLVVILAITKLQRRTTRSITNVLLLNLAIADLLRSVICIPPTLMSEISQCWLLGPHICKFAAYLQPVTVCASAYTLALIALERYYAICRPLESKIWLSKRRLLALISFVWLIAFGSNVGALVIYDAIPYKTHWSCRSTATPLADFLYQIHVTMLLLFIPLAIMLLLYCKVIKTLHPDNQLEMRPTSCRSYTECYQSPIEKKRSFTNWFQSSLIDQSSKVLNISYDARNIDTNEKVSPSSFPCNTSNKEGCNHDFRSKAISSGTVTMKSSVSGTMSISYECGYMLRSNRQEKIIKAKRRVIRMLIIIVIAFVICWTPSFIWWLTIRTSDLVRVHLWNRKANAYITLLTHISTCTNPITYCFMNERFRKNITAYLWSCTFQTCKRSLREKSPTNRCMLRRAKYMAPYNSGPFGNESNVEQAVAIIPFISSDSV
uniref:G-protein coupled receptors family 1 profile domain-containing protein n=1 Tax=Setaria digitata TaxID=48799 RepID=A0A915PZU6_9BILA